MVKTKRIPLGFFCIHRGIPLGFTHLIYNTSLCNFALGVRPAPSAFCICAGEANLTVGLMLHG